MADRVTKRLDWFTGLMLFLGVAGFMVNAYRGIQNQHLVSAKGSFWSARNSKGDVKRIEQSRHLVLERSERLDLHARGPALTFTGQRRESSTFLEFTFPGPAEESWTLIVDEETRQGVILSKRNGTQEFLYRNKKPDFLGLPFQPLTCRLEWKNGKLSAKINGKTALEPTPIGWTGEALGLTAREGRLRLDRIAVEGGASEDFSALEPVSPWPRLLAIVFQVLLIFATLGFFLRSFCLGKPPRGALIRATVRLFFPSSFYFSMGFFVTVHPDSFGLLVLMPLGLVWAIVSLKGHVRIHVREGTAGRVRAAFVSLLCIGALCFASISYRVEFFAASLEAERAAQDLEAPLPYTNEGPMELGPHNSETVNRVYRNAEMEAEVFLEEGAIFQLRVRAPSPGWHDGISLILSSDPRFETGFYLETKDDFKLMGRGSGPLEHGKVHALKVIARGRNFEALLDGRTMARASTRIFSSGAVVLLAAKGFAEVKGLKIVPLNTAERQASYLPDIAAGAALPLAFVLVFVVLASFFLRISAWRVLETCSLTLLPVTYCLFRLSPSGTIDIVILGATLLSSSLLLFIYLLIHSAHLSKARYFTLALVIVLGDVLAVAATRPRAWPVDHVHISQLSLADWSVDPIDEDLIHLQHPLLRRWNVYLAQHELRDRTYELEKKPGTTRILALGTSSTHGYWVKAPYPFCLEHLLRAEKLNVEVIIGAYPGATGVRLFHFFKNVLLDFKPDIVTLSLYYNDAYALTQLDEAAFLKRVMDPRRSYSFTDAVKDRLEIFYGAGRIERLEKVFAEKRELPDGAPARFEKMLRAYAELSRERGIKLVLIKEPVAGDVDRLWKKEFYDAMDRVGAEFSIPVVDPTPLLMERGGAELFMDNVHPYLEGGIAIAEAMLPTVRRLVER